MVAAPIGELENGRIGIGNLVGSRGISRVDPNVMARFARDQFAALSNQPILEMGGEPVGVLENEGGQLFGRGRLGSLASRGSGEIGRADQGRDNVGESGRGITGTLLPAFLAGNRSGKD